VSAGSIVGIPGKVTISKTINNSENSPPLLVHGWTSTLKNRWRSGKEASSLGKSSVKPYERGSREQRWKVRF